MKLLGDIAAHRLKVGAGTIEGLKIAKCSTEIHDKNDIHFKMDVLVTVSGDENEIISLNRDKNISIEMEVVYTIPKGVCLEKRPVVVGCGPAGMFAALVLAQAGARPILLERGLELDERRRRVTEFWHTGILDTKTNVQFGEGGAGAFSDGKLKVGFKDNRKMKILNEFVEAGAPPEITYLAKPHIGTDRLHETVKNIRNKIISLGGEVRFNAQLTEIICTEGHVRGAGFIEDGRYEEIYADNLVLAIGHSARDTFEKLLSGGVRLEQKPFAVGLRIEHPQELINRIKFGAFAGHPALGAADYKMVVHLPNGRGVYTFCMCPGGMVVASASEENAIVTNGMSNYARDGINANTALMVTLDKADLKSDHPLAGIAFQRRIEAAAFAAGGGSFKAPVQRLEDFLEKRNTNAFGEVLPTYRPGTGFAEVDTYLPADIADSLRQALKEMGEWMPGFSFPDALLTGAETRSASPVRIPRGENLEAVGIHGLYPCGEGAGYGGGIISAAVDGILCAERILSA